MIYWIVEWKSHRYPHKSYVAFTFDVEHHIRIEGLLNRISDYHTIVTSMGRI